MDLAKVVKYVHTTVTWQSQLQTVNGNTYHFWHAEFQIMHSLKVGLQKFAFHIIIKLRTYVVFMYPSTILNILYKKAKIQFPVPMTTISKTNVN